MKFKVKTKECHLVVKIKVSLGESSRSHADIITRGSKYFITDLNSKNHTYINGQLIAVQCEVEIHDGDRVKLANEEFVFNM